MMLLSACCVAGHWMFPSMQSAGAKRNCLVRLWQRTNPSCSAARGGERKKQPCILPKVAAAIRKSSPRWMKLISANGRDGTLKDRKSVGEGKRVSVRLERGGRRIIKKK